MAPVAAPVAHDSSPELDVHLEAFASAVGAEPYLRRHPALPLGFYVDVPQQQNALLQDQQANTATTLPLDLQQSYGKPHLYHGWWLLMQLSGLLAEGNEGDLRGDILSVLPADALWRLAAEMGVDEMERIFTDITGPKPDFIFALDWLTTADHPMRVPLMNLLAAIRTSRGGHD